VAVKSQCAYDFSVLGVLGFGSRWGAEWAVLGFELRALHLVSSGSIPLGSHPSPSFAFIIFRLVFCSGPQVFAQGQPPNTTLWPPEFQKYSTMPSPLVILS
jgi:hypothetical protein